MKICPECGRSFEGEVTRCKRCGATLLEAPEAAPAQLSPEALKKKRRRDWIALCVGLPVFMGFLYLVYSLLFRAGA